VWRDNVSFRFPRSSNPQPARGLEAAGTTEKMESPAIVGTPASFASRHYLLTVARTFNQVFTRVVNHCVTVVGN
jgi:hypothetical protein